MNIVTFPLTVQMDRIVRQAKRIEKRSIELLKKYRKNMGIKSCGKISQRNP
tara:strand:- start:758 stop:910 length:153 start_codon:yes stop_codon:yes gene_type:complete